MTNTGKVMVIQSFFLHFFQFRIVFDWFHFLLFFNFQSYFHFSWCSVFSNWFWSISDNSSVHVVCGRLFASLSTKKDEAESKKMCLCLQMLHFLHHYTTLWYYRVLFWKKKVIKKGCGTLSHYYLTFSNGSPCIA